MSPPTKPTTCIDDLPPEMICELFEHLHPKDLTACSMVNRRWHSIYSNFKLHKLVVMDYDEDLFFRCYASNQPIREVDQCRQAMFIHLVEKPLLSHLKHLALSDSFKFDLNQLNHFQQLVHLEIELSFLTGKVHLTLLKLKVLAIYRSGLCCHALSIDCPLLSTLVYDGLDEFTIDLLEVKQPETIKKLVTHMVDPKWLALFKNVECLVTWEFRAISKATLLSLPRLRELHLDQEIRWRFDEESRRGAGTVDRVKRTLNEFLDEAKKLKGDDFRFRFSGLQLTNVDQIDFGVHVDEYGSEKASNEYVYMKNYHLIEPGALLFVDRVDYTGLLSHVTGEFPRCFFEKFTGIKSVSARTELQDVDHFFWFLKSLRSLRSLELEKKGLGQEFFDQLPASVHSLKKLALVDLNYQNELHLSFDFVGKFSGFSKLKIYTLLGVTSESLPSLVRSLGKLKEGEFHFQLRGKDFEIKKFSTDWIVEYSYESLFEAENSDEILKFFEGHQD